MKCVYGPVSSWRLGRLIGIDPICNEKKLCSFNCTYCQFGSATPTVERGTFVTANHLTKDLGPFQEVGADVFTFSGTGEPTLAKNLNRYITLLRSFRPLPLAILTNASFLGEEDVAQALSKVDLVVAKLDAPNQKLFDIINRPHESIRLGHILGEMKAFRESFKGKFALQCMFVDANKRHAKDIARLAKQFEPDEVQLNTPLRPSPEGILNIDEINKIKLHFAGFDRVVSVYDVKRTNVHPLDIEEIRRRKLLK